MKYFPMLYIIAVICVIVGYLFISWLMVAGVILFAGTAVWQFLRWVLSPIKFKIKNKG